MCLLCRARLVPALFVFQIYRKGGNQMKECKYKNYDELPLVLNAKEVAKVLGLSLAGTYELMRQKDFPAKRIGKRIIVPRDEFLEWLKT